jgi:hypothetical protein
MAEMKEPNGGSRPVPDPTVLTMDAIVRACAALREFLETRMDEKLRRIDTQISERDVERDKASKDVKSAVDAAFAAAKEAVGEQNKSNATANSKMEAAFTKQSDLQGERITANIKTVDDKIDDLKARVGAIEGRRDGKGEGLSSVGSFVIGGIAALALLVSAYNAFKPTPAAVIQPPVQITAPPK